MARRGGGGVDASSDVKESESEASQEPDNGSCREESVREAGDEI